MPSKSSKKTKPARKSTRAKKPKTAAVRDVYESNLKHQLVQVHENRRLLDEDAFYPAHDKRKESPKYAAVHKMLVVQQNLPCLVCGVTNAVLKDPKKRDNKSYNPFGAKAMETHHHIIEWALANAIDPKKFNKSVFPYLKRRHPEHYPEQELSGQQILDWVDHSEDNLWVLCDVHHRHKFVGIHAISYPIWCPQDLVSDAFIAAAQNEMQKNAKARPAKRNGGRRGQ